MASRRSSLQLLITSEARAALHDLIDRCRPREACAAVLGTRVGRTAELRWVCPLRNRSREPNRFAVLRAELDALAADDTADQALLALFHSHPGEPAPSQGDLPGIQDYPVVWIIGSVRRRHLRLAGYVATEHDILPIPIRNM